MLGKILKYELKASARVFLLMYAALIAFALISAALSWVGGGMHIDFGSFGLSIGSIFSGISTTIYWLMVVAVFVVTIVIIAMRFYRLLGDEGYLWFTLPATANQHILGKLLAAIIWTLASCVALVASWGLLLVSSPETGIAMAQIANGWQQIVVLGFDPTSWVAWLIVIIVIEMLSSVLMLYAAMAIGPNLIKSRLGGSVLAYLILYTVTQVVSLILLMILVLPLSGQMAAIGNAYNAATLDAVVDYAGLATAVNQIVTMLIAGSCVVYLALSAVFYYLTHRFVSRNLNLA